MLTVYLLLGKLDGKDYSRYFETREAAEEFASGNHCSNMIIKEVCVDAQMVAETFNEYPL